MDELTVYRRPGGFAGWPANYGLWRFDQELVAVFVVGHVAASDHLHARDMGRPFAPVQVRSTDGGVTWTEEPFTADLRGVDSLSADEHVIPELRAAGRLTSEAPVDGELDFERDAVLCARTGLFEGAESWYYRSADAAKTWQGPFRIPGFDRAGVAARTDVVPLGRRSALWMLSSPAGTAGEGGTICVRTDDGGASFELRSVVQEEDGDGYAIMPSTVRLPDGAILTVVRRPSQLESWRSEDDGDSWLTRQDLARTGVHGNPASLVTVPGGAVAVYGVRDAPYRMAARFTSDGGASWGTETVLVRGIGTPDFGYPRTVDLPDGRYLTIYYRADTPDGDRRICAVTWHPNELAGSPATKGNTQQ
ncbi:hypothetical protein BH10ACT7_BH10ACT7_21050 [soil metagenome]